MNKKYIKLFTENTTEYFMHAKISVYQASIAPQGGEGPGNEAISMCTSYTHVNYLSV